MPTVHGQFDFFINNFNQINFVQQLYGVTKINVQIMYYSILIETLFKYGQMPIDTQN